MCALPFSRRSPSTTTRPTVLVTGGAGFIGSALVWELNRRGITDIIISDFLGNDEKWKNLVPLQYADYVEADELLKRIEADDAALTEIRTIYHLGACSSTTERNATYLIENNFAYTCKLAQWALRHRMRFVYASSAATYGDGSAGMDDHNPEANLKKFRPLNMYGYSKHMFDQYALREGFLDRIVGLKYFNVFGPNENHKGDMRSLVNKAYDQITQTGKVSLFKSYRPEFRDGEQQRDFLYVKDAVTATIALANSPHPEANGLFNIGSGKAHTWIELASAIFSALDLKPQIEFIEMPEQLKGKYQYYTCADISKLHHCCPNAVPKTPLVEAVKDYVCNYLVKDTHLEP